MNAIRKATMALGLIALAHTLPVHAAKLYQVELVVFANEPRSYERREIWPTDIDLTLPRPLQLLRDGDGIAPGASADMNLFESLPRENLALKNEAAALSRSGHRILLHKAWLQSIGGASHARNIYLEGGNSAEPYHELAGTLRLYRQQFVHVETNLWLAKFGSAMQQHPAPQAAPAANAMTRENAATSWPLPPLPPQQSDSWGDDAADATSESADGDINALLAKDIAVERIVLMQQHRRLKQKELNYLDHPLFGALIVVTPYGAPAEAAATTTAGATAPAPATTTP
jgi:hypothetical protein